MKGRIALAALALTTCAFIGLAAHAQGVPATSVAQAISAEDAAAIRLAIDRGQLMYRYDQAAWHTTDAMIADLPRSEIAKIRGWIVTAADTGLLVTYYGGEAGQHFGIYSAIWTSGTNVIDKRTVTGPLAGEIARLAAARDAASSTDLLLCANRPFNTIILPRTESEPNDSVYFLTPQTATGSLPMGGHHRIDVANGHEVARRSFTRGCIELTPGNGAAAMVISHSLDPIPTEVHVFSVYGLGVPLFVSTNGAQRVWSIDLLSGSPRVRLVNQPR